MFASLPVDPGKYSAFLIAMAFLAVSPGPANLFCIRTGLAGSRVRVFFGVTGTNAASLVWFTASALGLGAVMTAFPMAFHALAILGSLYVGWLGLQTFLKAQTLEAEVLDARSAVPTVLQSHIETLREGFMVQLLNPKVLLFFTAILPPFLDTSRPVPAQMMVFAATAIGMDVLSMSTYGFLAVSLSRALRDPRNKQRFDMGAGAILMLISVIILSHEAYDLILPQLTKLTNGS